MTFTVDTHYHMLPDFFWQATNEADPPGRRHRAAALVTREHAVVPRRSGIDVAVTSISTPACTPATTPRPAYWPGGATNWPPT